MPLNLEPRSADFVPYIKFNAKSGRWYTRNADQEEVEVPLESMTAIFDLENIKVGWILFNETAPPEYVWDNGAIAASPGQNYKRGFSVNLYSPQNIGGLRELSSVANSAIVAIKELYEQYENAQEAKNGMVPVVKCVKVLPIKSKFGINYQPVFGIQRWVARPDKLNPPAGSNQPAQQARRPAAIEDTVPPPLAKLRQAATEPADANEEF